MNKLFVFVLGLMLTSSAFAQNNILNAKDPNEIGKKTASQTENDNDTPLPYGFIGDRDVLWSRTTWEKIDLDERVNFPLYYPIDTNYVGKERRALFHVIASAARNGEIDLYSDSYFNEKREFADIETSLSRVDTSDYGIEQFNAEGRVDPEFITKTSIGADNVSAYNVRGLWYLDTRQGEMRYRILGIAPVTPDVNFMDDPKGIELFWIYYPDVRELLHNAKAFNTLNSAKPISFDHILNSRRFSGVIYKMDNVHGDRKIEAYIADNSMMQLLESERLKDIVRNKEIDMWNY
tara:strand:- start:707 stop:1582 length:876 start_codon:yes stop_codon:yes gene_type:complete